MAFAFLFGRAGHLFIFYLGGVATYLFSIWGWPSSFLGGGGLATDFGTWEGVATYYFFYLGGMGIYLFLYLGGDGQLSVFLLGEGGHVFFFL